MQNLPRIVRLGVPALLVALVAGFAIYKLFIEVEAPDEVTTDAALEQLAADLAEDDTPTDSTADDAAEDDSADSPDTPDASADDDAAATDTGADDPDATFDGVIGTWAVDDEFGDFTFDSASGSFAGFRVAKSLFTGQGVTAVGRTGGVSGTLTIDAGQLTGAEIAVDMTSIVSDESGREGAIRSAVKASDFPTATFVVVDSVGFDTAALEAGDTVALTVDGQMTIAGTTNDVSVAIEATVPEPGVGLVVGSAEVTWADFGVETPSSIAGTVADEGIIEFQLVVRPSQG